MKKLRLFVERNSLIKIKTAHDSQLNRRISWANLVSVYSEFNLRTNALSQFFIAALQKNLNGGSRDGIESTLSVLKVGDMSAIYYRLNGIETS